MHGGVPDAFEYPAFGLGRSYAQNLLELVSSPRQRLKQRVLKRAQPYEVQRQTDQTPSLLGLLHYITSLGQTKYEAECDTTNVWLILDCSKLGTLPGTHNGPVILSVHRVFFRESRTMYTHHANFDGTSFVASTSGVWDPSDGSFRSATSQLFEAP